MLEYTNLSPEFWQKACANQGGFVWWYLDLRGSAGSGLVLLWGVGLPFVPRGGTEKEGALQLVYYEAGRAEYYHLATFPKFDELAMNGSFELPGGSLRVSERGGEVVVEARLRDVSPYDDGFELELEVRGPATPSRDGGSGMHLWAPRTVVASARVVFDFAGRSLAFDGSAYFDSNAATVPLPEQNIDVWRWGRLSFPDETVIFYDVEGPEHRDTLTFSLDRDGRRLDAENIEWFDERRALFGVVAPRAGRLAFPAGDVEFHTESLVDDGPFYQRYLIEGRRRDGSVGRGFYEVVVPGRLDRRWQRPLVAMRVRRADSAEDSRWLPLFRGARRGRVRRLLRSWLRGTSPRTEGAS